MLNLNHFGRAAVKAMSPKSKVFGNAMAIQKRNQCKHEGDKALAKGYDAEDSQFTDQELNLFKKLFMRFDRDENCKLDRWEFNNFAKFLVGRSYNSIDLEKVFSQLDKNEDGTVEWDELMAHVQTRYKNSVKRSLKKHFDRFDKDRDGKLRYWETKVALERLGLRSGYNRQTFNLVDSDKDRCWTFKEFCEFVTAKRCSSPVDDTEHKILEKKI